MEYDKVIRSLLRRLTWRHGVAALGDLVVLALSLGMGQGVIVATLLVLQTVFATEVALTRPTATMVMSGGMACGGVALAAYVVIRFGIEASNWWEGICGIRQNHS